MNIRTANIADAPVLCAGEHEVAKTPGLLVGKPGEIGESAFRQTIEQLSTNPNGLYIVAEEDATVLGHLLLEPMTMAAHRHICRLNIVVYPTKQGQGIGRALMTHALEWATGVAGVEKIELLVRASNHRAIRLYQSLGFEEEGRLRQRIKVEETYLDDITMGLFC